MGGVTLRGLGGRRNGRHVVVAQGGDHSGGQGDLVLTVRIGVVLVAGGAVVVGGVAGHGAGGSSSGHVFHGMLMGSRHGLSGIIGRAGIGLLVKSDNLTGLIGGVTDVGSVKRQIVVAFAVALIVQIALRSVGPGKRRAGGVDEFRAVKADVLARSSVIEGIAASAAGYLPNDAGKAGGCNGAEIIVDGRGNRIQVVTVGHDSVTYGVAARAGDGSLIHQNVLAAAFDAIGKLIDDLAGATRLKAGIQRVHGDAGGRNRIGGVSLVVGGLVGGFGQSAGDPALEAPVIHVGLSGRQRDRVTHIGIDGADSRTIGHVGHGCRSLGGEVDADGAVGGGGNGEGVAVLNDGGGAGGHSVTGGIVAGLGGGSDGGSVDGDRAPGGVVGGGGHGVLGAEQMPLGVGRLDAVNVAVAQVGILVGNDDREGDLVGPGAGFGVGAVGGVPLAAQIGLGLLDGGAGLHIVLNIGHDGLDALQLTREGHGLRVAVDRVHVLGAEAGEHLVGSHAQADAHIEHGVRGVTGHVVGNGGAVDECGAAADNRVGVGAVGAGLGGGIGAGQTGGGVDAEVRGVGAGGVVLVGAGVVSGAVGVENDQTALLHRAGNRVDVDVRHGVTDALTAGGAVEVLPGGLIIGRVVQEGGIGIAGAGFPVGLDQADVDRSGSAAALRGLQHSRGISLDSGNFLRRRSILGVVQLGLHARVVAAGDALDRLPVEVIAVLLQGTLGIGRGAFDGANDLRDQAGIVGFFHHADAAHLLGCFDFDVLDAGENVSLELIKVCLRVDVGLIQVNFIFDEMLGCHDRGEHRRDHSKRQNQCKKLFQVF